MAADSLSSVIDLPTTAVLDDPVSDLGSQAVCSIVEERYSCSDVITPPAFSTVDSDAVCESER